MAIDTTYLDSDSDSIMLARPAILSMANKLNLSVSVKDFGAVGDGVTDDTAAFVAAATALTNGDTLDFVGGTYLVSYQGTSYSSVYGNVIFDLLGKSDLTFIGNGATIKIVNHNITTHGGLRFMNFKGCKRINISGFNFDMTFTGVNTSGSFYPFCGAITGIDDDGATPAFSTLNSDFIINDCKFKLYHPYGNWATTSNPYSGDSNNGYKLFSVFMSGANTPTSYDNQCRNIAVTKCTFQKGHNGYGLWFWAWNNSRVSGCVAEAWVSKYSNSAGTFGGGGVAMIRHIPFRTAGMVIEGNNFRAMPTPDRVSGFEGASEFYMHANNMGSISWDKGLSVVTNNNIILGTGSLSGGADTDSAVFFNGFGQLIVSNNNIDGHKDQNPSLGAGAIALELVPGGSAGGDLGASEISVTDNTFGAWNFGGIYFTNGSTTSAAARRCKSLVVTNNTFTSGDYFLRMAAYSAQTYDGCQSAVISGNIVQSQNAGKFPPPSINNYGIFVAATEATDSVIISSNVIRDKTYSIQTNPSYVSASAKVTRFDNQLTGNTTDFIAGDRFIYDQTTSVIVQALSDNATYPPYLKCTNTSGGSTKEMQFLQQSTSSLLICTNDFQVYTDGASQTVTDSNVFRPSVDNTKTIGNASFRWSTVYAGTGTINTSDEREKQDIAALDDAEQRVASALKGLIKKFRFKDAVQSKGDAARIHIGVMAQEVMAAFQSEGLDPLRYSIICYDEWDAKLDDNGNEVRPAGNRYGVRYEELLAFIIAAL